ncbi:mitochondrial uncoupling protein 5-like [Gossypium australe]|uniref:Mitochondrial uncoupling protein 5-like n=1 Tax=Gossypium australe TaxID=47621 RepID=A0A5B6X2X8_9ROSI|nr:mitochondrial uncoupling protein 5-like [Gossypium australe]
MVNRAMLVTAPQKQFWQKGRRKMSSIHSGGEFLDWICGGSGVESWPSYTRALDFSIKIVKAKGPMALYKGFIPTISRQGPFTVVIFVTLEQVRKLLKNF